MLLAADLQMARAAQRRARDGGGEIAVDEGVIGQDDFARGAALFDRDVGLLGLDLDFAAQRGAPCSVARGRDHRENRLVVEQDACVREHRLVGAGRRDVVFAGNVGCGDNGDHARKRADFGEIDAANGAPRDRRAADRDVQRARRLGNVIDIFGRALHVLGAAVMLQRLVNVPQRSVLYGFTQRHRRPPGAR